MERVIDKLIILAFCVFLAVMQPFMVRDIVALLVAVSIVSLFEVDTIPSILRITLLLAYVLCSIFIHQLLAFLPIVSYDCWRLGNLAKHRLLSLLRFSWILPPITAAILAAVPPLPALVYLALCSLCCLRAWRSDNLAQTLTDYRYRRDELSATAQAQANRNRDLEERQSLELRLATLAERSRIAREIHDNVGHLLTRSVLQVEALQVTHTADDAMTAKLSDISHTLHEAYDTVRESVHGLYEDSFELHTQLLMLARETEALPRSVDGLQDTPIKVTVNYDFQTDTPTSAISYSLLVIVREAFANTLKHSNATTIKVSLLEFPNFYQMTVQDNGSIPPQTTSPSASHPGIGLTTMDERARSLGGILNTSFSNGFRVFVSIPKEG
ncbi:MAG: histidine kinase [Coriobacteriia bacterium]|nr:histidine kinase [Coriobacteriia bacterium]